ncbi:hypothetical protein GCM10008018_46630 [Paenibacillus marchantiophytorum]|uniref:Integrase n=1 Tax=Paenibacillus marchantiophytorum TaxID=1619310 RepID=A0ABQ1EZM5_9BACL|nr:hypothetical protein [Paenibacillus marchantiophytorum]GFZ94875.1 hypothetical protein GCM10008018_46630 [Paenibacillus marchantiophytorum]
MGKKRKTNTPRAKRMNRDGRLQSAAASWLKTYTGNRHIYGYRKHFGVCVGTAIAELRVLGVPLSDEVVKNATESEQAAIRVKQARKEKRQQRLEEQRSGAVPWSDETYAYIAGYTSGGFPFGVTWEEMERFADRESLDRTVPPRSRDLHFSSDEEELLVIEGWEAEEVPFDLEEFMLNQSECLYE